MEFSDDDSFAWTTSSSYSSEECDENTMARGDIGKNKRHKPDVSVSRDNSNARDSVEMESRKKKKSKIKEEPPDENVDVKNINVKKEHESQESDEEDFEACVKRERAALRHRRDTSELPTSPDHTAQYSDDKVKGEQIQDLSKSHGEEDTKFLTSNIKKSKKKRKRKSSIVSDKGESVEETMYEQTNGDLSVSEENMYQNDSESDKILKLRNGSMSMNEETGSCMGDNENNSYNKSFLNNKKKKSKHNDETLQIPKISDRIRFEDDDDPNLNTVETDNISPQLRRFLNKNSELSLASLHGDILITKDDDLFLLNCPKEVDINLLEHKDLILDHKCKFKIDGHSFDGSLEEQSSRLVILSVVHNKSNVINLPLNGIVNFRKRIPKAHYIQDSIMANNQTNFIPLPDTKCRHPLFGSDYKKAIKIPAAVKARLNALPEYENMTEPKKKKKKKSKIQSEWSGGEESVSTKVEADVEDGPRKRKKHRHTDSDEVVPKKKKKIKHDPGSPVAWESEKAIEKNLFDF